MGEGCTDSNSLTEEDAGHQVCGGYWAVVRRIKEGERVEIRMRNVDLLVMIHGGTGY